MEIFINGKQALIKSGSSFEYVSENRYFTGADAYTMKITFPLEGCPSNIDIFGHIQRQDVAKGKVIFDCEISDRSFYKFGSITITEINDSEVECQFLEGRSEQNNDCTFDDIYINELNLFYIENASIQNFPNPESCWKSVDESDFVALPWVNNASGFIENNAEYSNNKYCWNSEISGLSFQPYLIKVAKRICDTQGYSCDFSAWDKSDFRHLLVCNALPFSWDIAELARALPHWSITQFFEYVERLLNCEFDIDHKRKNVVFAFAVDKITSSEPILLDKVLDEYTVEVSEEDESDYTESANIAYKECSHSLWSIYSCQWYIDAFKDKATHLKNISELIALRNKFEIISDKDRAPHRGDTNINADSIIYVESVDTYFITKTIGRWKSGEQFPLTKNDIYNNRNILIPINQFGEKVVEVDNENSIEIPIVPAWIDSTYTDESFDRGYCIFLDVSSYSESIAGDNVTNNGRLPSFTYDPDAIVQYNSYRNLIAGSNDSKNEYLSLLYVAFWDGKHSYNNLLPCPVVDRIQVVCDTGWKYRQSSYTLRVNSLLDSACSLRKSTYNINPKQKFTFSFLADSLPNIRSLFFINGKKYVCKKITATFSEHGMSQLLKGEFYQLA